MLSANVALHYTDRSLAFSVYHVCQKMLNEQRFAILHFLRKLFHRTIIFVTVN